jgi:hypothetical protein
MNMQRDPSLPAGGSPARVARNAVKEMKAADKRRLIETTIERLKFLVFELRDDETMTRREIRNAVESIHDRLREVLENDDAR